MKRENTKKIKIGNMYIGGDTVVPIQSMTNTDTRDIKATVKQISLLEKEGCDIIRVAIPDAEAANAIIQIKEQINIPLVADIHFDYKLAVLSIKSGADKIRINPGNIGPIWKIKEVINAAKEYSIPIRIGVNSGSLEEEYISKYNGITYMGMVDSIIKHIDIFESFGFKDIIISLKASSIQMTIDAYKRISELVSYPLHIGITEAGTPWYGTIKSSIGIGSLLLSGIGNTLRVSLTGEPLEEIRVGKAILKCTGLLKEGVEIISCPTCGRCEIDLEGIAGELEKRLSHIKLPIRIAVMGCVVNGPGEAKEADIGIAGGKGIGILFKNGKLYKKIPENDLVQTLINEVEKMTNDN